MNWNDHSKQNINPFARDKLEKSIAGQKYKCDQKYYRIRSICALFVISFTPNNRSIPIASLLFPKSCSFYNLYANACFCDDWVNQFFSFADHFLVRFTSGERTACARARKYSQFHLSMRFRQISRAWNGAEINDWDKPLFDFRDDRGSSESGKPCDTFAHTCETICAPKSSSKWLWSQSDRGSVIKFARERWVPSALTECFHLCLSPFFSPLSHSPYFPISALSVSSFFSTFIHL